MEEAKNKINLDHQNTQNIYHTLAYTLISTFLGITHS